MTGWRAAAACASQDPDLFFSIVPAETDEARAICRGCPSRVPCLLAAFAAGDYYGVRAGLTGAERKPLSSRLTGRQAAAVLHAADEAHAAGRSRRVAATRMTGAAKAAAEPEPGQIPPDPDAAEHCRVLLRELLAWEAGRPGRKRPRSHRAAPVLAVLPAARPGDGSVMAVLKQGRNEAIRHRRANRPVPDAVAELERAFWRAYKQGRRGGSLAA